MTTVEVKILASALALGIVIDATIVRGVHAPALVAALGDADWRYVGRRRSAQEPGSGRRRRSGAVARRPDTVFRDSGAADRVEGDRE